MGLFLDLDPEQMVMDENLDDPDLEAELAAITGNRGAAGGRVKNKEKSKCQADDFFFYSAWLRIHECPCCNVCHVSRTAPGSKYSLIDCVFSSFHDSTVMFQSG